MFKIYISYYTYTQEPYIKSDIPSLKELYKSKPKTTRFRDFMTTIKIRNPDFNYNGSKYKSIKDKKSMGTEGLKRWLIDVVKEYKE